MKFFTFIMALLVMLSGCKKFVDIGPPVTGVAGEAVYNADATAIAALNGIYTKLSTSRHPDDEDITTLSMRLGLSADELELWEGAENQNQIAYYTNSLFSNPTENAGIGFWSQMYANIYNCNAAIEGLQNSSALTPQIKTQLVGEAKFIRALNFFYLVNLYGNVPLVLQTDYKRTAELSRTDQSDVYEQIIRDLHDAQEALHENYRDLSLLQETTERVRPNKYAATALLARVYLYRGDWSNAEAESSRIIDNAGLYHLPALNEVFLANSPEAIWQLQPVSLANTNSQDGKLYIIPETGLNPDNPVQLSNFLMQSFELNDKRGIDWIGVTKTATDSLFYAYKYKVNLPGEPTSEYTMILRLAEQFLIRAEARAQQDNITGAQDDLNIIRARAGLDNTAANDKPSLLQAILHERRVELFTESGHRWLDLKRTGEVNNVMPQVTEAKGGTWNSNWQWYPILFSDIQKNNNLTQNDGY